MNKDIFFKMLLLFHSILGLLYIEKNEKNFFSFYILILSVITFLYSISDVVNLFKKNKNEFKEYIIILISFVNLILIYFGIEKIYSINIFYLRIDILIITFLLLLYILLNLYQIVISIFIINDIENTILNKENILNKFKNNTIIIYLKNFFNR